MVAWLNRKPSAAIPRKQSMVTSSANRNSASSSLGVLLSLAWDELFNIFFPEIYLPEKYKNFVLFILFFDQVYLEFLDSFQCQ